MNGLGKRLDELAKNATSRVRLIDPALGAAARTRAPFRKRTLLIGLAAVVAIGFMLAAWQRTDGSSRSVVAAQGDDGQNETVQTPCDVDAVRELLAAGIPAFDYEPAGSYVELADSAPDVVSGRVVAAQRVSMNGRSFVEVSIADVVDVYTGESRDDVDLIAYDAVWADRSQVDPLASPVSFQDVRFVGFFTPWSGVRGGWAPGAEGLYVGCGDDKPSHAVIVDAAGPGDPASPTLAQLIALVRAPLTEAVEEAERSAQETEEAARAAEEERRAVEGDPVALAEDALTAWLPLPTRPSEDLRARLGRTDSTPPDDFYLLHDALELEVWLYRDTGEGSGNVCVTVVLKTGDPTRPAYGAITSSCVEDTQFVTVVTWLAANGAGEGPPFLVLVPPVSYLDENWTTDVQSPEESRTLATDRSVIVIFQDDGPPGGAYVEIQCECGDIGRSLIIN